MVKPVGPVQKTAELDLDMGKKNPQEQPQPKGPGKAAVIDVSPEAVEKSKADSRKMAEEYRAKVEAERPRTYTERLQDMGRLPKGGGSSGTGGAGEIKSLQNPKAMKKGGTASARADGCAVKGKTKGTIIACTGGYMKGKK